MFKHALLVFIGGGAGSLFRYILNVWFPLPFPFSTLIVNIVSSLVLGLIVGYLVVSSGKPLFSYNDNIWYLLLATGFCGGLSTFSSFTLDNYKAIVSGAQWIYPILNIISNVAFCYLALVIGVRLGKLI